MLFFQKDIDNFRAQNMLILGHEVQYPHKVRGGDRDRDKVKIGVKIQVRVISDKN